jgi:hypothetical protein
MNLFGKYTDYFAKNVKYKIIEVPPHRTQTRWDDDTKAAVSTLSSHPGFVALMDRMFLQRALIEQKLTREFHKDMREVDVLQAGLYWLTWLQDQVQKATVIGSSKRTRSAEDEEIEAFGEVDAHIERIGSPDKV